MMTQIKQLAIIGPTASGKSDLAIKIAKKIDAYILSIDSLSIYKEIDIVSAKPSKEELESVKHFGINVLYPNEYFSVDIFITLYKEVVEACQKNGKNLIIVGGTSFYLKSLLQGLSDIPKIDENVKKRVAKRLENLHDSYELLNALDPLYMKNINKNDSYRIEKALLIYEASHKTPTQWFLENPPKPVIEDLPIFNIEVERDILRERIAKRTKKMLLLGLIDEVCVLEHKYTREPHPMASIGILEVLEFLDAKVDKEQMLQNIATHTAQLAKRQQTFNKTQFENLISAPLEKLEEIILKKMNA
ncbi:MAG: tRNA (adenosine(37)-N6)-dimethylallyltransferase MiaA [Sulfurimonas sp.]|nr:tRNA (adenosine(37)-N6)-dimethylallyltransferase MiaA [Sulfurimonas sp.]MBU1218097.1 tRNA (adenosine(37)-N6)-dimethylallyltransferase MiaA [bacterium]MBU1434740.1 tRNA (adenosine(37)-N6)-dimethylallyltransferase MiaA [bacterium]MBU1502728.1 tRNA (adenosine(37)-N6)-dimethylallyltransferase MiaA [bacterium]MBU3940150.1 tRNA (adenosine(37)-N6)-dimethylallyltransferase MiaA [bacterium]